MAKPGRITSWVPLMVFLFMSSALCALTGFVTVWMPLFVPAVLVALNVMALYVINKRNAEIYALSKRLDGMEAGLIQPAHQTKASVRIDAPYFRSAQEHRRRGLRTMTEGRTQDTSRAYTERHAELDAMEKRQLIPVDILRVGHKERDEILMELGHHYAEGRIDADEFEARSTAAGAAKTAVELIELVRDLPVWEQR